MTMLKALKNKLHMFKMWCKGYRVIYRVTPKHTPKITKDTK